MSSTGVRTSDTDPIRVDWLTGIDLAPGRGKIGLTFAPGKSGPAYYGPPWKRDLDKDLDRLVGEYGIELLVCLMQSNEIRQWKIEGLFEAAQRRKIIAIHDPVEDLSPPTLEQARRLVGLSFATARAGRNLAIHCRGGLGRTGTVAACCYVAQAVEPAEAIRRVRAARPGSIETKEQERFVEEYFAARPYEE
jgi:protein-tyrosine phosphatase